MAKRNSTQASRRAALLDPQKEIPEAHRSQVHISEDGEWVFFNVRLPRFGSHLIRKSVTKKVDRAKIKPDRFEETYEYGEGRKMRDGAETKTLRGVKKDAPARALVASNTADAAELLNNATAHADVRTEWIYGKRDGKQKSVTVDTLTHEYRLRLQKFALKNLVDSKGAKFKVASLPSQLVKARTVADAKKAAAAIGVPEKNLAAIEKSAKKIAAAHDDDTDMSIEV